MVKDSPLRKRIASWSTPREPDPQIVAGRPGAARGKRIEPPRVQYVAYGRAGEETPSPGCDLVATLGDLESEYAAIRRGAGLLDSPHRATIRITGSDRRDFLNRMVTQELKDLDAGVVRQSFWLNRRGRIVADLLLAETGDHLLACLDVHGASKAVESLGEFLFTEDVEIVEVTDATHHLALHGPMAARVIAAAGEDSQDPTLADLPDLACRAIEIRGNEVLAIRCDQAGVPGFELIMKRVEAEAVWEALLSAGQTLDEGHARVRPIGWHAYNIARIEAGTPLFNIDFGTDSLAHETGLLAQRVSFTKGCYLGQEIVARTENLGRPKQRLVGLRPDRDLLPSAGAEVVDADGKAVGAVTSSTLSPMLGAVPIAFAMIRLAAMEGPVRVMAEGELTDAVIVDLKFHGGEAS
ncbi:MAG: glycine cleavage T C-terminal barrel domain-containing protein [Phycisphaerales bacterium]